MSKREDWEMRPPTNLEFLLGALSVQDDVSWYNFRDSAVRQGYASFEADYQALCTKLGFGSSGAVEGKSPARVHNVGPNNIWGYNPGIECTFNVTWSGFLFQPQIDAINQCYPIEAVLGYGAGARDALSAVADRVKQS